MLLTVFTPTYNRATIIENLYKSLQRQTCKDFEWVVVDDGSSDGTEELFTIWQQESSFLVKYIKQENGGKHRAINRGVKEAQGELFFIVDSDDYLADDAIEKIFIHYNKIKENKDFAGVCGLRCYPDGQRIGGECDFGIIDCNSLDFRYKYKVQGDMAEVIRTDVMREFPIPEFDGEKFCPEALFFYRIAQKYKLRFFYEKIYICDYLPDGLTAQITKIRMQSSRASMIFYAEQTHYKIPMAQKIKAAINYWRFSFCSSIGVTERIHQVSLFWIVFLPLGYILHQIDSNKIKL